MGASVAGVRTARELRAAGYVGEVVLIGDEPELPYDKTPLSKAFLAGARSSEQIRLLDRDSASALDVQLRLGAAAVRLDVADGTVELAGGELIAYDTCVLATGARARPSPWGRIDGVHVLRTMADSAAIRADLVPGASVVVVGGGFIGSEVAATARGMGCEVTIVDPASVPMGRVVGAEIGELFGRLHRRHGVTTLFGVGVDSLHGVASGLEVGLTEGAALTADTVVVGIGAQPNVEWLASSGLLIDDGVVCDEHCRTTAPDVFAIGDIARWFHPRRRRHLRVEHWTNAGEMATCVARTIADPDEPRSHAPVEYVWTDQYDWRVQVLGYREESATASMVGDLVDDQLAVLFGAPDGALTGAMTVNRPRALSACRRALAGETTVSAAMDVLSALAR